MPSHCPQSLYYRDFPTFGVRGGGNSKKRTNVVAQTTLLKKYLYGMVNDRQLSTSLKKQSEQAVHQLFALFFYISTIFSSEECLVV